MNPAGYTRAQIALHWVIGVLIVLQLLFGDSMTEVWRGYVQTGTASMTAMAWGHIVGGSLILALVLWRLVLRLSRGAPGPATGETPVQALIAKLVHVALYALMLLMPLSGLVAWYGDVRTAGDVHELLKAVLWVFIGLHVLGAVYNHFVLKNGLIGRMLKPAG
ncbi:MAG: cytochrome b/b6 domain-containing protein [Rhodobacteraceae bacterium]|nr:cytochrome b/b6 domain-containing protein [Paracoccaceae bacterium]